MKNYAEDFPVVSQYTYVNTAASGLLSESLYNWRQEHELDFLIKGSIFRESYPQFLEEIRKSVATFFKAESGNTVLVPNFSFGFNTFLSGLNGRQKVLLIEGDYPSVNWPVKARGYEFVTVEIDEHLEDNIEKAFKAEKPTMFAFSIVQYINGVKIDLKFINELKAKYPEVLFIADGTQYCGTESFDFSLSGIDILGASGYKWMLSGFGNGFLIFKDHLSSNIFKQSFKFEPHTEDFLQGKNHLTSHFEPGHHDSLNYGSLKFSIENQLNKAGAENIGKHLNELSVYAKDKFSNLKLLDNYVLNRKEHSTIFGLNVSKKGYNELRSRDVICSLRGGKLRVSFHLYNSKKDIDKITSILKNVK
ncbi:aminotransferase class V-fold PLP-dependent enzyme [Abyssalbus ytuae]|uniref:Aminotransferase class V-fold PLP-dependent enzyme n=1 Tax=Abyssalbus ytuae TaxID=2926907 RepID=A0A9E6ZW50_9FLAO|nr:aminotransferase class V-fold PLP-dependent enzyme [Abyssalbus ytuae]UOB18868.1 aminotransferase class V-fold PLP-dependent enzyme [Abyssalbus ytuae]